MARKEKRSRAPDIPATRASAAAAARDCSPTPIRRKLLFTLVLLGVVLGVSEGASRLFRPAPDAVWRLEQAQFTRTGFPALGNILEFDRQLFWRLRPDLENVELAARKYNPPATFTLSSDALSCRRIPRNPGASRTLVFLGDSATVGLGVNDDETFSSLIQARRTDIECRNLGCVGYTAYQGRGRLGTFPFERTPDVVVMAFGVNDNLPWDDLGDAAHDQLLHVGSTGLARASSLYGGLRRALLTARLRQPGTRARLTDDEYAEQLREMIGWCRQRGAQPVLLLWPYEPQMRSPLLTSKQAMMRQVATSEQVTLVDLVTIFKSHAGERLFYTEVHLNAAGHRLVADCLLNALALQTAVTPVDSTPDASASGSSPP